MNKILRFKKFVFILLTLVLFTGSVFAQEYQNGMKQGVLRIKMKPQLQEVSTPLKTYMQAGVLTTGIQPLDAVNKQFSAVKMKRVFPYSARHEAKHQKYGLHLWYEVQYTSEVSPTEASAGYNALEEVVLAEPIFEKVLSVGKPQYVASPSNTDGPFNDPYLSKQWHYNNTGELLEGSIKGADINLFKAWEVETGKSNVVVCIVDGGVDVDHEDLAANMWVNQAEMNGEEGVDDDGNGYVDDINGYNFVNDMGRIENHFHGTHVAGTISAVNNNGIGVAGVAGGTGNNDGVKLMSAQIFTEDGGTGDYPAAIVYGADNGAVISQNSWGYNSPGHVEQTIHDAIDYFVAEAGQFEGSPMKGGLVFFAAGNDNADGEWYPGYYETAIAVASIGADFKRAAYSNYGTWVEIAAPGGDQAAGTNYGVLSTLPDDSYGYLQGTSMACPHMSGVAALVVSKYGNGTFTSEDLKKHILSGTQDVDQYNPGYEGKLGIGYVDTWLALQNDQGIAPNAITDLALDGIAQDFASISWTIPADEDDIQPTGFEVLYHTEAITSANAEMAQKINLTGRYEVGATKQLEISELEPTTTYYVAVRSIDRWGNVSELSNIITGTTNEGPAINTDQVSMDFVVDAAVSTTTAGTFTILNEAAGVLKWNGFTRQKSISLSYNAAHLNYPSAKTTASPQNIRQIKLLDELDKISTQASVSSHISPLAYFYKEMSYAYASTVIGEMDTTLTNSSAIRFYVDQDKGFNLTDVQMMLKHNSETGPMIMEVYQGEQMDAKNMIYAQEVDSYRATAYTHQVKLEEQLYFEKGSAFWIVFHVPSSNLYPLGMGYMTKTMDTGNNLMSNDLGRSWITLDEALGGAPNYGWGTKAISKNEHLGNFISLNPSSGIVEANDSQSVDISLNASTLINGTYGANVLLKSNDGDNKIFRMPVSLKVSGQEPILVNDKVIDFGSVFYGHTKEISFTIKNTGYGNFNISKVISSDDQFEIVKKPYKIAARDEAELTIRYKPDGAGNDNGSIDFTDKNGRIHSINLFGVAAAPSEIQIAPAEVKLDDMALGDTASASFTITNTGGYPLEYVIPAFAENVELEGIKDVHKFGYTLESNVDGDASAEFIWNDISEKGVEVTDFFKSVLHRYQEVDLGFDFPFYGKNWDKINITRYGILSMDPDGALGSCMPSNMESGCSPDGFISALGEELNINKEGRIFYYLEAGKFIVQYQDVIDNYAWDPSATFTFQIVLFYNGDVEFRYKDIERMDSYFANSVLIGLCDPYHADGFLVNGNNYSQKISGRLTTNETVFRVKAPGQKLIASVSEPYGMIKVGETKKIDVEVSTASLYEGSLFQRLAIVSNDPFHNPQAFSVKVDVTSGGSADVVVNKDKIEMGQVFQGGEYKDVILVKNEGSKHVDITSVALADNKFNITAEAPVQLKANSSYFVYVDLITTDLGLFEDVLTITTSEGNSFEITISGEVVPGPGINTDITPIVETLEAGDMMSKTITIENNGAADLEIVPSGNDWLYLSGAETMSTTLKDFTYHPINSDHEGGPAFNWEELIGEGERTNPFWFWENEKYWKPVALPYELDFYDQKTDTIWIGWQGVISMSKPTLNPTEVRPDPIPSTGGFNNIIAPYFAYHTADIFNPNFDTEVGVFHKIYDDRIVIEWGNFIDPWAMGQSYSFEAILYTNGNIKFQYKLAAWSMVTYGVVGVENADGTDGVQLAAFQEFVKEGLAVTLAPAKKQIIPMGQSKDLTIKLDASHLNKGDYKANFRILNNTPENSSVILPVSLTVNGEPALKTVSEIAFGEVMAYKVRSKAMSYEQEFEVKNSGKADLEFYNIAFENDIEAVLEIRLVDPNFGNVDWVEVTPWSLPVLLPGDKMTMRIRFMPSGSIAEVSDNIVFETNLADGDYKLPVHSSVILPPVIELDQDTVSVMANIPTHQEVKTLTINNTNGLSPLKYQLAINFLREGEEQSAESSALVNTKVSESILLESAGIESANIQLLNEETYNTVLEYDTLTSPSTSLGFGAESSFVSGTVFKAPEAGLNLTHVKTWYMSEEMLNSRIQVEVRAGGTNITDARLLTREAFDFNLEAPVKSGQYVTFELSDSQVFYPGESFYVIFTYPLGVAFPQGTAKGVEDVAGRYFYASQGGWYDIHGTDFGGFGWMVKAMEKEAKGGAWVTVDGELEGEVPAGESLIVNLNFDASKALEVDNKGELAISTNDPKKSESAVDLFLHKNQGPQYVFDPKESLSVDENEALSLVIPTSDIEDDARTFALAEAYDFVQMTVHNDTISLVYSPDFESSGAHAFTINGEDEYGNTTSLDIPVEVINVNRSPELVATIETREYYQDDAMDNIDLTNVFVDPDGEELYFDAFIHDATIANIYTWNKGIMVQPLMDGSSSVMVTATDSEGLSVDTSFDLFIGTITGIEDLEGSADTKVYPVPTTGPINIILAADMEGEVSISIINVAGITQYSTIVKKSDGDMLETLDMSDLPAGIYLVKIATASNEIVKRVVKL